MTFEFWARSSPFEVLFVNHHEPIPVPSVFPLVSGVDLHRQWFCVPLVFSSDASTVVTRFVVSGSHRSESRHGDR